MSFDNIHENILNDFDKIKVVSSSELSSKQEHRLLDNVEMWTLSENSVSAHKGEENNTPAPRFQS